MKTITFFAKRGLGYLFILFFLVLLLSGCFRYFYKVNQANGLSSESVQKMKDEDKYFILHDKTGSWRLGNPDIIDSNLVGTLNILPSNRHTFNRTDAKNNIRYRKPSEKYIIDEVHIYSNFQVKLDSAAVIPLNTIDKIELYVPDKDATFASWVLAPIGTIA